MGPFPGRLMKQIVVIKLQFDGRAELYEPTNTKALCQCLKETHGQPKDTQGS